MVWKEDTENLQELPLVARDIWSILSVLNWTLNLTTRTMSINQGCVCNPVPSFVGSQIFFPHTFVHNPLIDKLHVAQFTKQELATCVQHVHVPVLHVCTCNWSYWIHVLTCIITVHTSAVEKSSVYLYAVAYSTFVHVYVPHVESHHHRSENWSHSPLLPSQVSCCRSHAPIRWETNVRNKTEFFVDPCYCRVLGTVSYQLFLFVLWPGFPWMMVVSAL